MASIIIGALVLIALYVGTKRLSGLQLGGVILFTLLGTTLAIFPGLSSKVASFLNVGRGTDLVFYFAVLCGLFVASNFYFRFKRNEEALVLLARRIAIDHAEAPIVDEAVAATTASQIKSGTPSHGTGDPAES
jgi:hypothetical protein